jgi:hypothetical protein
MMDRDTVQSEENQAGLRRRDLPIIRNLLLDAAIFQRIANKAHERCFGMNDELGEFCDAISSAIGRLEKSIEGDR